MSANGPSGGPGPTAVVEIKSQFELEFRRISVPRAEAERLPLDSFYRLVKDAHCLPRAALVLICCQHPRDMRQTPLESAEELAAALRSAAPLLRLFVSRVRGLEVEVSGSEEELGESGEEREKGGGRGRGGGGGGKEKGRGSGDVGEAGTKSLVGGRQRGRQQASTCTSNLFHKAVNSILPDHKQPPPSLTPHHQVAHRQEERYSTSERRAQPRCGEDHEEPHEHPLLGFYKDREEGGCGGDWERENGLVSRSEESAVVNGLNRLSLYDGTPDKHQQDFLFVVEIYGFSPNLTTQDLLKEFHDFQRSEFAIKWVDDTHVLGIFASERQAWLSAGGVYKRLRTRMVREGTEESIAMAEKCANELRPSGGEGEGRPKTTAMVARRMVSSALGIRVSLSQEQREKERRELHVARENKQSRH